MNLRILENVVFFQRATGLLAIVLLCFHMDNFAGLLPRVTSAVHALQNINPFHHCSGFDGVQFRPRLQLRPEVTAAALKHRHREFISTLS